MSKYILLVDVAECYRSLYTHSLTWALHGKATGKKDRSNKLLGNRLDKSAGRAQDGQTNGLPVGPDTSLILAEVVLTAIDHSIRREVGARAGLRYFDDLELYFDGYGDAQSALATVQSLFAAYDLQLNGAKTTVRELPLPVDPSWFSELRDFEFTSTRCDQKQRVMEYFDRVFALWHAQRDSYIIAAAISRISEEPLADGSWALAQRLMHNAVLAESSSLPKLLYALTKFQMSGKSIDRTLLGDTLSHIVAEHGRFGRASEVAWAVWGALAFGVTLDRACEKALSGVDDAVVALLSLDAQTRGLLSSELELTRWASHMTGQDLWGPWWLLAYEANVKKWLPSVGGRDHVDSDPAFSSMKKAGVAFCKAVRKSYVKRSSVEELRAHTGSAYADEEEPEPPEEEPPEEEPPEEEPPEEEPPEEEPPEEEPPEEEPPEEEPPEEEPPEEEPPEEEPPEEEPPEEEPPEEEPPEEEPPEEEPPECDGSA